MLFVSVYFVKINPSDITILSHVHSEGVAAAAKVYDAKVRLIPAPPGIICLSIRYFIAVDGECVFSRFSSREPLGVV